MATNSRKKYSNYVANINNLTIIAISKDKIIMIVETTQTNCGSIILLCTVLLNHSITV